jgi:hypothetical protein
MQSGSYFTNLMSNDSTDPGEYGGTQSQNMKMPTDEGVVQHDDIPPSDAPPATEKNVQVPNCMLLIKRQKMCSLFNV